MPHCSGCRKVVEADTFCPICGDELEGFPGSVTDRLQAVDRECFERFVADLWDRRGWATEDDREADLRANESPPGERTALLVVEQFASTAGDAIDRCRDLSDQQDPDEILLVTANRLTEADRERLQQLDVRGVDGDDLAEMADNFGTKSLVEEHLSDDQIVAPEERSKRSEAERLPADELLSPGADGVQVGTSGNGSLVAGSEPSQSEGSDASLEEYGPLLTVSIVLRAVCNGTGGLVVLLQLGGLAQDLLGLSFSSIGGATIVLFVGSLTAATGIHVDITRLRDLLGWDMPENVYVLGQFVPIVGSLLCFQYLSTRRKELRRQG